MGSGELLALGVSHKTAPLDLRERLSLTEGRAVSALGELTAKSASGQVKRLRRALDAPAPGGSSRIAPEVS